MEFIEILNERDYHRYLGRQLCISPSNDMIIEFQNRSRATLAFTKTIKHIGSQHIFTVMIEDVYGKYWSDIDIYVSGIAYDEV